MFAIDEVVPTECKLFSKQECIPVGCVPAARRPYAGVCFPGEGGGCLLRWGVVWCWGGVCSGGMGGSGAGGGVSALGGLSVPRGICSGGCLLPGGVSSREVSAPRGWYPSMH